MDIEKMSAKPARVIRTMGKSFTGSYKFLLQPGSFGPDGIMHN
jgi:hypothetical protein